MGQDPGGRPDGGSQSGQDGQATANSQQDAPAQQGRQPQQARAPEQPAAPSLGEQVTAWFTETIVRALVALFGLALLLFALGRLLGANLLEIVADFLTSSVGTWLVIAFFALLLIVAASKSWTTWRR